MKAEMFFIGNSMIVDADDSILAQAGPNADEIIVVDLHLIPTE
jgi:predicted amidohydrolase